MGEQLTRSSLSFILSEQLQMIKANCQFELHFFIPADNQSYADPDKIVSLSTMSPLASLDTQKTNIKQLGLSTINIVEGHIDHMDNVTLLQLQFISCLFTFLIKIDLIDCINVALFFSASCAIMWLITPPPSAQPGCPIILFIGDSFHKNAQWLPGAKPELWSVN